MDKFEDMKAMVADWEKKLNDEVTARAATSSHVRSIISFDSDEENTEETCLRDADEIVGTCERSSSLDSVCSFDNSDGKENEVVGHDNQDGITQSS